MIHQPVGHHPTGRQKREGDEVGVEVWECEGALVASLRGELDVASVDETRGRIMEMIDAGWRRLVVDLSELEFCDSTGLGLLVAVGTRC
ncbi:MAG: STAS domain-containing protein, partial [Actinocatenispora sp.]